MHLNGTQTYLLSPSFSKHILYCHYRVSNYRSLWVSASERSERGCIFRDAWSFMMPWKFASFWKKVQLKNPPQWNCLWWLRMSNLAETIVSSMTACQATHNHTNWVLQGLFCYRCNIYMPQGLSYTLKVGVRSLLPYYISRCHGYKLGFELAETASPASNHSGDLAYQLESMHPEEPRGVKGNTLWETLSQHLDWTGTPTSKHLIKVIYQQE